MILTKMHSFEAFMTKKIGKFNQYVIFVTQ